MKIKILSMSSVRPDEEETKMKPAQDGLKKLLASTEKYGYDHEMLYIKTQFGGQMPVVVDWCERNKDNYTHILYTDAFDTLALAGLDELMVKLPEGIKFFGSAEKAVFPPDAELQAAYPKLSDHDWKFVNAGQWFCEIEFFLKMVAQQHPQGINDQVWLAKRYVENFNNFEPVLLDYDCLIFQSIAFEGDDDFASLRTGRLLNRRTHSQPIWIHGNGHTNMDWIHAILDRREPLAPVMVDVLEFTKGATVTHRPV